MDAGTKQTFLQIRHLAGQEAYEKMLDKTYFYTNANQNYNETLPHTSQNQFSSVQLLSHLRLFATP